MYFTFLDIKFMKIHASTTQTERFKKDIDATNVTTRTFMYIPTCLKLFKIKGY